MTALQMLVVFGAGMAAGAINVIVGSGTLITFPVLLAVGYPPVVANVSNTVGLVPGSLSGAWAYRPELAGQGRRLLRMSTASVLGGLSGGLLLLVLPPRAFRAIVPTLIALACVLVVIQPRLARRLRQRRAARGAIDRTARPGPLLFASLFGSGVYGGYFGAAQGVLLIAILGLAIDEDLQRLNAAKNVLAGLVNLTAALLFLAVSDVSATPALLIAAGSMVGGQLGARLGRRLPAAALRGIIVAVGGVAILRLLGA